MKSTENKIPDVTNLGTKTILNTKVNEGKAEIPSISDLATTYALTAVENKIPNFSNLVKKSDYDTKVNKIEKKINDHKHEKYITTPEFNKLTAEKFVARLAQANLVVLKVLIKKITPNKTKHLIVENELKKLETFDSIHFRGKNHFQDDGTQNYLVFQPVQMYFKIVTLKCTLK